MDDYYKFLKNPQGGRRVSLTEDELIEVIMEGMTITETSLITELFGWGSPNAKPLTDAEKLDYDKDAERFHELRRHLAKGVVAALFTRRGGVGKAVSSTMDLGKVHSEHKALTKKWAERGHKLKPKSPKRGWFG